jgi:hypothetical protein
MVQVSVLHGHSSGVMKHNRLISRSHVLDGVICSKMKPSLAFNPRGVLAQDGNRSRRAIKMPPWSDIVHIHTRYLRILARTERFFVTFVTRSDFNTKLFKAVAFVSWVLPCH